MGGEKWWGEGEEREKELGFTYKMRKKLFEKINKEKSMITLPNVKRPFTVSYFMIFLKGSSNLKLMDILSNVALSRNTQKQG